MLINRVKDNNEDHRKSSEPKAAFKASSTDNSPFEHSA